jgi:catechol 2,3-dioxygenase-like lactoylglutathione lyase family enzyme
LDNKKTQLPTATTIDHVGFTVPDLSEAISFFEGVGFELLYQEGPYRDRGDALRRQVDVDPEAEYSLAMLRFGSTTTLELLEYRTAEATSAPPRNSDHSAAHLGLRVTDIDRAAEWLRSHADVEVLDGPVTVEDGPSAGLRWIYVRAPWGLQLELVELPPALLS